MESTSNLYSGISNNYNSLLSKTTRTNIASTETEAPNVNIGTEDNTKEIGDTYTLGNVNYKLGEITLNNIFNEAYLSQFTPKKNCRNLDNYVNSEDFQEHAKTACIYYNKNQLHAEEDVLRIAFQREPTNFANTAGRYHMNGLKKLFCYECSVYNDPHAQKKDGTLFTALPNTVCVYSETYLWNENSNRIQIAILSLPVPALDNHSQPNYSYFMNKNALNIERYQEEIKFLFKVIEEAIQDHYKTAFNGKGIQRVVLTRFNEIAFLKALTYDERKQVNTPYRSEMDTFIFNILNNFGLNIVMSEYSQPHEFREVWYDNVINGSIIKTAEEGDFIVNLWNPHSAPGNGNDCDNSFDGDLGSSTGILPTQSPWLNLYLRDKQSLRPV